MGTIRAERLGKYYKRYANRWSRLAEWLDPKGLARHEQHWVLRDIDFEVRAGESVGIVGQNGAGKSTLLKIITGTTRPSAGKVHISGHVAALLELGMGFHPDFTGRQNTYMSGQLLGYGNEEIAARMQEIEAFADIGDYIDQPTRTYSSGMQVRLAFAVATCVRPDILIVDEALSVGDIFFQQKCFARIRSFKEQGTTLLFVTHSMSSIYALCDRAILLDHGALVCDASPQTVVDLYQRKELEQINRSLPPSPTREPMISSGAPPTIEHLESTTEMASGNQTADTDFLTGTADIERVDILQEGKQVAAAVSESEIAIAITLRARADLRDPHIGFQLRNVRGESVFQTNTYCMRQPVGPMKNGERITAEFAMRMPLAPGDYSITVGVANEGFGEGDFNQALTRQHAAAKLTVLWNRAAIRWEGVCNLFPRVQIARHPS